MRKQKILTFITDGNNFLALKTAGHPDHGPSKWFTITGSIENDETPEEAVKREIKEETFLDVKEVFQLNWDSIYDWNNETCNEMNFLTFINPGLPKFLLFSPYLACFLEDYL